MEQREFSSVLTRLTKFVLSAIWAVMLAVPALGPSLGFDAGPHSREPIEQGIALVCWFGGIAFFLRLCIPLKRVRLAGNMRYVSNYRREIAVPLAAVERVSENRWVNLRPITIHLRQPSEFGRAIAFVPRMRFVPWGGHPLVVELEDAVRRARGEPAVR